jgi:hypothetical protein
VATDVGISLFEVLPLSVDQALSLSTVSRRRLLDPVKNATLVHRSALFLHGLYRSPSSSMPPSRAQIVYVCALAMTFLFQPEIRDNRMMREFQQRIGEFRPPFGLRGTVGDNDFQQLVMDFFRMVYHYDICCHTRFSILFSYATWFNEGRSAFLSTPGVQSKIRDSLLDSNGAQLLDNYAEYAASEHERSSNPCYQYSRQSPMVQPDVDRIHRCNPNDLALFFSAQETFYRRCIHDLNIVTTIMHRKYHCCRRVCGSSHNPYRYVVASRRLIALITILEWIVSEYVVASISNPYNSSDPRRLCMALYDQFPYEGLLARAYNLRLFQRNTHLTKEECQLLSLQYYPCVNHSFRQTYVKDQIFDEHFYASNASPVPNVSNYFDLPYDEMTVFPLTSPEYRSLVHNVDQFYQQFIQKVHDTIHQAVLTLDPLHLPSNMLSFATLIGKLFWIKNQDHVRERLWQHLLSYLSCHYYIMVYHQRLSADHVFPLDKHDSLYVPSA